jgi:hypothetical protein
MDANTELNFTRLSGRKTQVRVRKYGEGNTLIIAMSDDLLRDMHPRFKTRTGIKIGDLEFTRLSEPDQFGIAYFQLNAIPDKPQVIIDVLGHDGLRQPELITD